MLLGVSARLKVAVGLIALAWVLGACGGGSESGSGERVPTSKAGYPVTVKGAYGELTVTAQARRIVVLSPAYVDMLTSVGVQPVAISGATIRSGQFDKEFPWLAGTYTGAVDSKLVSPQTSEASLERVASYKPDLILGHEWSVPKRIYGKLSKIAPTYVSSDDGSVTTAWPSDMAAVGRLTGRTAKARAVMAAFNSKLERLRGRVSELEGKTYNSVAIRREGFQYGSGGPLALLGLKPADNQGTYTDPLLSFENVERLSGDTLLVAVWSAAERRRFEADPRVPDLPAAKNRAVVFSDGVMANASTLPSPKSVTYALDRVVPVLERSRLNTRDP